MRKLICFMICVVLLVSLAVTVSAQPKEPVINTTAPDCYATVNDGNQLVIFVDAAAPEGTLEYQWYRGSTAVTATMELIQGAKSAEYMVPQASQPGVTYYCCAVRCVSGGANSKWILSRAIRVEYAEDTYAELVVERAPYKTEYFSGEYLDLTGLKVRVVVSDGYFISENGEGLEINKGPYITVGEQKVAVRYKEGFDIFIITVKEAPHTTHTFGEWITTQQPSCTEVGQRVRECNCGVTEKEDIAALGHTMDDGVVLDKPTETKEGVLRYTCTVCQEFLDEPIPMVETTEPTAVITVGAATEPTQEADVAPSPTEEDGQTDPLRWVVIGVLVVAAIGVVVGTAMLVLKKKKKGDAE